MHLIKWSIDTRHGEKKKPRDISLLAAPCQRNLCLQSDSSGCEIPQTEKMNNVESKTCNSKLTLMSSGMDQHGPNLPNFVYFTLDLYSFAVWRFSPLSCRSKKFSKQWWVKGIDVTSNRFSFNSAIKLTFSCLVSFCNILRLEKQRTFRNKSFFSISEVSIPETSSIATQIKQPLLGKSTTNFPVFCAFSHQMEKIKEKNYF